MACCVLHFCNKIDDHTPRGNPSPISPVEEGVQPTAAHDETPPPKRRRFLWQRLFMGTSNGSRTEHLSRYHTLSMAKQSLLSKLFFLILNPQFICPLTLEIMDDPVIITASQTERTAIKQWLQSNNTDPNTRQVIGKNTLTYSKYSVEIIINWKLEK